MERMIIIGNQQLRGNIKISGAKNAALPILAATILSNKPVSLHNLPNVKDIHTFLKLLSHLGANIKEQEDKDKKTVTIDTSCINKYEAPYELVRTMRASVLVLGPLLAKYNKAVVSLPGGCAIGARPINLHLKGLQKLGAEIEIKTGYVYAKCNKLIGCEIYLDIPSVGATENIMMAAVAASGKTIIYNAAKEPEVVDLAAFLNKLGANIKGAGSDVITIIGDKDKIGNSAISYSIIPDRIEAGTYMVAAAITKGTVTLENINVDHLEAVIDKLEEIGVKVDVLNKNKICVSYVDKLKPINIKTLYYPGFPTDMQAQFMALLTLVEGTSTITETIFENRFMHVPELNRMGANITLDNNTAIIKGVKKLSGCPVMATDLRASAALVLAGLAAKNKTQILRIYHLDRGYESIDKKLAQLGAKIYRIKE